MARKSGDYNKKIKELFEKYNLNSITGDFSMTGDSGDIENIQYLNAEGQPVTIDGNHEGEVIAAMYDNMTFYEATDGVYEGEFGQAIIILDNDELVFSKEGHAEYNTDTNDDVEIKFSKEEYNYIKEYVKELGRNRWNEEDVVIVYDKDFILTDKMLKIEEDIKKRITNDFLDNYDYDEGYNPDSTRLQMTDKSENPVKFELEYTVVEEKEIEW